MSIDRAAAIAYLNGKYGSGPAPLQTEAGVQALDDGSNYGPVLDDALLALGTAYDDLPTAEVASDKVLPYRALLRYYALKRFEDNLITRLTYNVSGSGVSEQVGALIAQLRPMIDKARAEVAAYGYTVEGTEQGAVMRTLTMDIYEPAATDDWA